MEAVLESSHFLLSGEILWSPSFADTANSLAGLNSLEPDCRWKRCCLNINASHKSAPAIVPSLAKPENGSGPNSKPAGTLLGFVCLDCFPLHLQSALCYRHTDWQTFKFTFRKSESNLGKKKPNPSPLPERVMYQQHQFTLPINNI